MQQGQDTGLEPFDLWSEWKTLSSTHLKLARYNGFEKLLEVIFWNDAKYQVQDVEPGTYDGLITSPSPGRYWHYAIRKFGYTILGPM